jgi:hypothetical protein
MILPRNISASVEPLSRSGVFSIGKLYTAHTAPAATGT